MFVKSFDFNFIDKLGVQGSDLDYFYICKATNRCIALEYKSTPTSKETYPQLACIVILAQSTNGYAILLKEDKRNSYFELTEIDFTGLTPKRKKATFTQKELKTYFTNLAVSVSKMRKSNIQLPYIKGLFE